MCRFLWEGQATPVSSHLLPPPIATPSLQERLCGTIHPRHSLVPSFPVTGSLQLRAAAFSQGLAPSCRARSRADVVLVRTLPAAESAETKRSHGGGGGRGGNALIIIAVNCRPYSREPSAIEKTKRRRNVGGGPSSAVENTQGVLTPRKKEALICTHARRGEHQAVTTASAPHTQTHKHTQRKIDVRCSA